MEMMTWFKMLLFLLLIGTVASIMGGSSLANVPDMGDSWGLVDLITYAFNMATHYVSFFSGFGVLLDANILPVPINYIFVTCVIFGWMFLFFEFIASVRGMFTAK